MKIEPCIVLRIPGDTTSGQKVSGLEALSGEELDEAQSILKVIALNNPGRPLASIVATKLHDIALLVQSGADDIVLCSEETYERSMKHDWNKIHALWMEQMDAELATEEDAQWR